ncbi:MAG: [Fe-S]-binding protein [Acidaminobacter sp.]|uniref:reductive dehalogenase domain-containing protein n=1 Tax=Acidaminobacter sp. TaxID=1872102 RepID=UPI00137C6363|nr:reductive dehalogenase domain-containing protein [Acidaminobacter sp.]MZQ96766.1 [Fe-S]-binding protein [Acidaminobacter sp.]
MRFPMPREYNYIRPVDDVWYGQPTYKEGLIVPEINIKYGSLYSKVKTMPSYAKYLFGSLRELRKTVKSIRNNPYTGNQTITPEALKELEDCAKSLGISGIGVTPVNESHMFKNSIVLFKNAIVFTMEMKKSDIEQAPSIQTNIEVFRTYYELGRAVNLIAEFLRERGFNAQAVPAISSNLNLAVMARDAGLGGFGKHGLLITDEFGPSVRIAAVLTDLNNLPFSNAQNKAWIKDFCDTCNACVRKCPAKAIYEKPLVLEDGSEQHIDFKKCAVPFSKQHGCTICIKECAFFKSDYEKLKEAFEKKLAED